MKISDEKTSCKRWLMWCETWEGSDTLTSTIAFRNLVTLRSFSHPHFTSFHFDGVTLKRKRNHLEKVYFVVFAFGQLYVYMMKFVLFTVWRFVYLTTSKSPRWCPKHDDVFGIVIWFFEISEKPRRFCNLSSVNLSGFSFHSKNKSSTFSSSCDKSFLCAKPDSLWPFIIVHSPGGILVITSTTIFHCQGYSFLKT